MSILQSSDLQPQPEPGHLVSGRFVRDMVLGMNDGMVTLVSFLGGLTGSALPRTAIIYSGVMTALAGALSMSAGGYLAARSQNDLIRREIAREKWEIDHLPELERAEVRNLFLSFGIDALETEKITERITANPVAWHRFMVREELGIHEESMEVPITASLVLGLSFLVGAIPPIVPYFLLPEIGSAFTGSIIASCAFLAVAGAVKSRLSSESPLKGAGEMLLLGGAAGATGLFLGTMLPRVLSHLPAF